MDKQTDTVQISNPFTGIYEPKTDVILFAHSLMGKVRGKSANGIIMHSRLFNVVAIIDKNAAGQKTSEISRGVLVDIPIYVDLNSALSKHKAQAIILLIEPNDCWHSEIELAASQGMDLINTSFRFIKDSAYILTLVDKHKILYFDMRDLAHVRAYPNINLIKRKTKVVFVSGTDCGLGKRTAAYELMLEARRKGYKAAMYATGQTGLLLGEKGIVMDALITEFANGVISEQVYQFCQEGYDILFVEGQADLFHPGGSQGTISLLHGSNPDCIIIVHDQSRKYHQGFEENAELYLMHPLSRHIQAFEILSLPCGPIYKTVGIATLGQENINEIKKLPFMGQLPVADVLLPGGSELLVNAIIEYCNLRKMSMA